MDCYYHTSVPSVAVCHDCMRTICATCRDAQGICPSCRLERRIKAAQSSRQQLEGGVGPSNPPPGPANPPPRYSASPPAPPPSAPPRVAPSAALATVSLETRSLLALGYPLWPLAALALLSPNKKPELRRQAIQALAFNFGTFGLYFALSTLVQIPLIGLSAWPILVALVPIWLVASVVFALKVWNGEDVRVPIIADWLDQKLDAPHAVL